MREYAVLGLAFFLGGCFVAFVALLPLRDDDNLLFGAAEDASRFVGWVTRSVAGWVGMLLARDLGWFNLEGGRRSPDGDTSMVVFLFMVLE
eukprot:CAMPEP_0201612926 /NCGR_PEP_ID=MMETSP0492-20130828/24478_1 /ASSEMBLY_ACC=CAM_ASM_000837 /TAXON_ID=420259 /ORGANISM="Thalassiosira gravida, Strain GMp14c1" /LENGTH=90 /DNA_ID=CAMNT_0048079613 /DNA_START=1127 /DNA_END=1399 /DNA_ORIENTATION=-